MSKWWHDFIFGWTIPWLLVCYLSSKSKRLFNKQQLSYHHTNLYIRYSTHAFMLCWFIYSGTGHTGHDSKITWHVTYVTNQLDNTLLHFCMADLVVCQMGRTKYLNIFWLIKYLKHIVLWRIGVKRSNNVKTSNNLLIKLLFWRY